MTYIMSLLQSKLIRLVFWCLDINRIFRSIFSQCYFVMITILRCMYIVFGPEVTADWVMDSEDTGLLQLQNATTRRSRRKNLSWPSAMAPPQSRKKNLSWHPLLATADRAKKSRSEGLDLLCTNSEY